MNTLRLATLLLIAAFVAPTFVAIAQVGPTSSDFEIDGDDGSTLWDINGETDSNYLSGTFEVRDDGGETYGRRQDQSCSNWSHGPFEPYMGHDSYRMQCVEKPPCVESTENGEALPLCTARRNEQMLLANWKAGGPDTTRYFTFAFRLNALPAIPTNGEDKRGYIAQLHHGGVNAPPMQVSWAMRDGQLFLESGVQGHVSVVPTNCVGTCDANRNVEREYEFLIGGNTGAPELPLELNVWYRLLFSVTLASSVNEYGCPVYTDTNKGQVTAWLMDNGTGLWEEFSSIDAAIGYVTNTETREFRIGSGCEFQWKVGIYANAYDPITMYLDNVAYGKRWNSITKNRLSGHHKTVLSLPLDEGTGTTVNDRSWLANAGVEGEAHTDYDNDGTVAGDAAWNGSGVGGSSSSFHFTGQNYLQVPKDPVDFDVGNYVTVSAWVRPTQATDTNRGIVMLEDSGSWRILMYMSKDFISFRVVHPDNTHSSADYSFKEGLYVDDAWHHVVGTYNRFGGDGHGVITLYVDGCERAQQNSKKPLPIASGQTDLVVGKFSSDQGFVGDIDEVNVLNYAWVPVDVANHHAAMPDVVANPCRNDPVLGAVPAVDAEHGS